MPSLFIFLIKANIVLTLFYLVYRFWLRRLTFYTLNRYFLLAGIAFSAIFPLVNVNAIFRQQGPLADSATYYAIDWSSLQNYMTQQEPFTMWNLLQYVFWAGVAVMVIRFVVQLLSLLRIHLQAVKGKVNDNNVKLITGHITPFSFFKNIYINPALHASEELETILAHEKIHVKGWHTLDVLAGEISNIFYWFNPGAWLMKSAIRENLEFITDHQLLCSGLNAKNYQYSLLKTTGIARSMQPATNFNLNHLKKRIMMMNKKRSARIHLLRYLLLLPVVALVAFMVSSSNGQSINGASHTNSTSLKFDTLKALKKKSDTLSPSKLPTDYQAFLKRNPTVKSLGWIFTPNGKGTGLGGVIKNGISKIYNGSVTAVKVFLKNGETETYQLKNSKEMKRAKAKYGSLPVPPTVQSSPPSKSGVQDTGRISSKIPADYRAFLKRNSTVRNLRWAKPVNGKATVVIVLLKSGKTEKYDLKNPAELKKAQAKYGKLPAPPPPPPPAPSKPNIKYAPPATQDTTPLPLQALYIVNGKKVSAAFVNNSLEPDNIKSITVLKDKVATAAYGEAAKNGVIIIKTKDYTENKEKNSSRSDESVKVNAAKQPLYIIDGKPVEAKQINPEDIHSINVLKDGSATQKYGEKGKDGVVEIYTKDFARQHPEQFAKDTTDKN